MDLTDRESEAIAFLHRNSVLQHRMGFLRKEMEALEEKGLVDLLIITPRKWTTVLTPKGANLASTLKDCVTPVSVEKASSEVSEELHKPHPEYSGTDVFEKLDYGNLKEFTDSVKRWVGDKSELPSRTINAADYQELYAHFSGMMGLEEKREEVLVEETTVEPTSGFKSTEGRPVLGEDAKSGVMGDILDTVTPYTEADPAGIVATTVATFSCMLDKKFVQASIKQPINCWFILMGQTGVGRKGTADNVTSTFMSEVDVFFWDNCRTPSLSTGEGLTYSVRDAKASVSEESEEEPDADIDRRLLVTSTEFAAVMTKSAGGTLGPVLRDAWDGKNLAIHTKDAYHSTNPHITIMGHVTPEEFGAKLRSHDMAGGTYNRFLPFFVEMPHEIPWPEYPSDYEEKIQAITRRLGRAVEVASQMDGNVTYEDEAKEFYKTVIYPEYNDTRNDSEVMKQFTTRRLPYLIRVSAVYALMNNRDKVNLDDVKAAKAVVDYSIKSARFVMDLSRKEEVAKKIVSNLTGADWEPDPRDLELRRKDVNLLREALIQKAGKGLTRSEISIKLFHGRRSAAVLNDIIADVGAQEKSMGHNGAGRNKKIYFLTPEQIEKLQSEGY